MSEMSQNIQMLLKIIFFLILPAVIIFFRFKKKIKTGFAIGLVITSLLLGLLASATVKEDPLQKFKTLINNNSSKEAKKAYKVLIQYGPEYLEKLDEIQIIDRDNFNKMKSEIIKEYESIAKEYYHKYDVKPEGDCTDFVQKRKDLGNLKHALKLINYSESIGGKHDQLKKNLTEKIESCQSIFASFEERCD